MPLTNKRILVVEDEYMIAIDLTRELQGLGATVVGPFGSVPKAMAAADGDDVLDAAVLDINLRNALVYEVADRLRERAVPLVLVTGYDASVIPEAYRDLPRCEKPVAPGGVAGLVEKILAA